MDNTDDIKETERKSFMNKISHKVFSQPGDDHCLHLILFLFSIFAIILIHPICKIYCHDLPAMQQKVFMYI